MKKKKKNIIKYFIQTFDIFLLNYNYYIIIHYIENKELKENKIIANFNFNFWYE